MRVGQVTEAKLVNDRLCEQSLSVNTAIGAEPGKKSFQNRLADASAEPNGWQK